LKNTLIGLIFGVLSCTNAQIPEEIISQFQLMEPLATSTEWFVQGKIYKVYYKLDRQNRITSYFDRQGNWLETETEIGVEELNSAVLNVLETKFNDYEIVDIEIIKTFDFKILYEIDLIRNDKSYDILFDTTGRILRKKI
tara:strand:- start:124 stop:543 length:420 start_codon:yes stop_codon:yes gene_type:complete